MDGIITLSAPQARLEMTETDRIELYLGYEYAEYLQGELPDGWWYRMLALHPYHWLRLSGAITIEPWDAFQTILANPERSPIPLPSLLVALFLAHSPHPNASEQRQVFQWVAYAVREMLPALHATAHQTGTTEVISDQLDQLGTTIIDALLHEAPSVPWPKSDKAEAQVLIRMAELLWSFPPALTRQIPQAAATYLEQCLEIDQQWLDDEDDSLDDDAASSESDDPISITPWSLLGNLSALRFWRKPGPTIRGLSVQAPMREILFTWYQALVIMHPDAPIIDDADLMWLCDETLGLPYDAPFGHVLAACSVIETLNIPSTELQQRIVSLQEEAMQGTYSPGGHWDITIPTTWSEVRTYSVTTMRLVVEPNGFWIRLMPSQWSWGSVLWWRPQSAPPTCWALAFGNDLTSPCLLTLHEALWELWRDFNVYGRPVRADHTGHPL